MARFNTGTVTAALLLFILSTGSALAAETGQVARVNGIEVFYGVIPAEICVDIPPTMPSARCMAACRAAADYII